MKIWTIANQKGGVGKTTTSVSLSGLLVARGFRVLMIDLDPHGSMTSYFGYDPDTIQESVYALFEKKAANARIPLASILCHTQYDNLNLLPASTSLVSLDRHLGAKEGMGLVIKQTLKQYEKYFDYVLIDCPPTLGILMINALAACEKLIIPVQTEYLAIKGLERMLNTLKMITMSGKHSMDYIVVPTMYDQRTKASQDGYEHLHIVFPDHLWDGLIPIDTKFRQASQVGEPINFIYPNTKGTLAYEKLLNKITYVEKDSTRTKLEVVDSNESY